MTAAPEYFYYPKRLANYIHYLTHGKKLPVLWCSENTYVTWDSLK